MKLVLTSTPATAERLTSILGEGWQVEPCKGMVRDLPAQELGINVEHGFSPTLTVAKGKDNLVRRLTKAIRACEAVYVATPPTVESGKQWHGMCWRCHRICRTSPSVVYCCQRLPLTRSAMHS